MTPHPVAFGGGATETILGPFVLVCMIIVILLIFALPRKYVVAPLLFGMLLCPAGQALFLGGVHLFVTRILILAGWVRIGASKISGSSVAVERYSLDKMFLLWALFRSACFIAQYLKEGALINQAGFLLDALGGFFLIRAFISDNEGVQRVIKIFAAISVVLALTMAYEEATRVNVYGIIGRSVVVPELRNGFVRAQGPFEHALLAGTFAATLFPLLFWLWKSGKSRILGLAGMFSVVLIVFTTQCSTPILALGAALFALCFWPFRKQMRMVRWGIVAAIIGLQMVMKAPFWWVIQHLDVVGGSSGWHRGELVDLFIRHFFDWWLIGTSNNALWGHMTWDICNQFVAEGESGGLVTFSLFVGMIVVCFKWLGKARKSAEGDSKQEWYFWALATALFSHVVAYFGISYFDQTRFSWYALLVMISVATTSVRSAKLAQEVPQQDQLAPPAAQEEPAQPVLEPPAAIEPAGPYLAPQDEYTGVLNVLKTKLL
ncbi:MAG TPA: hypothetical protein VEJ67_11805 [Candidatus Cybelea sp.]|nr:hypothetical protein [Candidatus Cybelea sp.]